MYKNSDQGAFDVISYVTLDETLGKIIFVIVLGIYVHGVDFM